MVRDLIFHTALCPCAHFVPTFLRTNYRWHRFVTDLVWHLRYLHFIISKLAFQVSDLRRASILAWTSKVKHWGRENAWDGLDKASTLMRGFHLTAGSDSQELQLSNLHSPLDDGVVEPHRQISNCVTPPVSNNNQSMTQGIDPTLYKEGQWKHSAEVHLCTCCRCSSRRSHTGQMTTVIDWHWHGSHDWPIYVHRNVYLGWYTSRRDFPNEIHWDSMSVLTSGYRW